MDILIIRARFDVATDYTHWIGEGLKAYLESKGHSVTDLSDAQASPENVHFWLNSSDMRTKKAIIAMDHGVCGTFYGEKGGEQTPVITTNTAADLTKGLHVYTVGCSTNADLCLGQKAVEGGCYSWLGYTETMFVIKSDEFKRCMWSYIEAMAEGKTLEQCEASLRAAYEERKHLSFAYGANLEALLLRKRLRGMTLHSHNRLRIMLVDSNNVEVNVSFSPGRFIDLYCKAEAGQQIWVLLQFPKMFPGVAFARPSDAYCLQHGRYAFLFSDHDVFSAEADRLYYAASYNSTKIHFGIQDFTGLDELIIETRKGQSPQALDLIQRIRLVEI